MMRSSRTIQRYSEQNGVELRLRIPWDSNTAKGFIAAVAFLVLIGLLVGTLPPSKEQPSVLPYEVLATINFGASDGTGAQKGNLTSEGLSQLARRTAAPLEDAERPRSSSVQTRSHRITPKEGDGSPRLIASTTKPISNAPDTLAARGTDDGSGMQTRGDMKGSPLGTGRGTSGSGSGAGLGYGDIEWGGGGSAIVVRKVIPSAPETLTRSTIVKLRFVVSSQGDVVDVRPIVRGAPEAENAAIRALRQWRFRPQRSDSVLIGVITFRFDVN